MKRIKEHYKSIIVGSFIIALIGGVAYYMMRSDFSLEEAIVSLWESYVADWGYVILFCWSILEGELGLIFAGIASHTGHLNVWLAIFIAGLGGFVGDQIYFYIGRFNKGYIQAHLSKQRRKLALAHLLLQKYGWSIIFIQRYMYGMRTIIPISIGLTRYSPLKFAIINLISAWVWAAITILLAWIFGDKILEFLQLFKAHPYIFVIFACTLLGGAWWFLSSRTQKIDKKIDKLQNQITKTTPKDM
ncbi:DedA family protein [Helicobacter canis]|uniref:DedA family protein n=1 Tax=Helicobacter canis TaxID=29419 RepID=A0A5M9QRS6_9HELI|nr:DedA family protein [Helicobacter canis]KAA8711414.1 DedA family protein [Helicobacter canis]